MHPLRTVFFGTAELACPSLRALTDRADLQVLAVVTQPDRPQGRHLRLQASPVKTAAAALNLPVWQPPRAKDPAFLEQLATARPDLALVVAYGQLLPPDLLRIPPHGFLNVHASLLPKYRGAAPIQWALLNGDAETGVTIMKIDEGLDTGDILALRRTPIGPRETAPELHDRLAALGAALLLETIPPYLAGRLQPQPQPAQGASYARKIRKEDGLLDWRRPAEELERQIRALSPWPGAFTFLPAVPSPILLKIWEAEIVDGQGTAPGEIAEAGPDGMVVACGQRALRVRVLQREGGRRVTVQAFLAGHRVPAGSRLSVPAT